MQNKNMRFGLIQLSNKRILLIITLFYFAFECLSINVRGQDKILRFEHLTLEDGLPQNTVHGIVKDKYGFMWFGTFGGLCKYDGYKFTIYQTESDNPRSIINNRIKCLYKDRNGIIWFSSLDMTEICRYNYESDDFTRFSSSEVSKFILDTLDKIFNTVNFKIKKSNYLWYSKRNLPNENDWYLNQVNRLTGNHIIYKDDLNKRWALNDKLFNYLYLDNNEVLWLGAYTGGINKADINAKPFFHYSYSPNNKKSIVDNLIRALCEDNE
jgi:ligand-binding sensor domain-containing protein